VDAIRRPVCDDGLLTARCVAGCRLPSGVPKCRRLCIAAENTLFNQDSYAMLRWIYVLAHLLVEAGAARRDVRIRFLKAQVEILRRKLGGNRVIPSPDDRARLLAIGQELNHDVADVIGIVTPQTYSRWVEELRAGRKPKRVGRPRIVRNLRELVLRLAKDNSGWGCASSEGWRVQREIVPSG